MDFSRRCCSATGEDGEEEEASPSAGGNDGTDCEGVGGYEWLVDTETALSILSVLSALDIGIFAGGALGKLVLDLNSIAASTCDGEDAGTGVKGMKTLEGNCGLLRRMYHPLFGR